MNAERLFERVDAFKKALARLHEAVVKPENDIVRDAVIQRFEFTYEMVWKAMKQYLQYKQIDTRNPKDTLREALQQGLIDDGNGWTMLHQNRNLTSHTYDETVAKSVYDFICADGIRLFDDLAIRLGDITRAK